MTETHHPDFDTHFFSVMRTSEAPGVDARVKDDLQDSLLRRIKGMLQRKDDEAAKTHRAWKISHDFNEKYISRLKSEVAELKLTLAAKDGAIALLTQERDTLEALRAQRHVGCFCVYCNPQPVEKSRPEEPKRCICGVNSDDARYAKGHARSCPSAQSVEETPALPLIEHKFWPHKDGKCQTTVADGDGRPVECGLLRSAHAAPED